MDSSYVFVKDGISNRQFTVDLSEDLSVGEILNAVTLVSISPSSTPNLGVTGLSVTGSMLSGTLEAGEESTSYGVRLQATTSLARDFIVPLVVQVVFDLNVSYATRNPQAFQALVGELAPGDAVVGKAMFVLPSGFDSNFASVTWSVLDSASRVHSQGNGFSLTETVTSFSVMLEAEALISLPTSTPPTLDGQSYQIRWELNIPDQSPIYVFESLKVTDSHPIPLGAIDAVEMQGDPATLGITLPRLFESVGFELFRGNSKLAPMTTAGSPVRTSSGWNYSQTIDTTDLPADLIPYSVSWKYWNSTAPSQVFRETAKLFILSGSLLTAIEDCRTQVMKARTTIAGFPDAIFDTATIISWLRRGRDQFNAAGGLFTHFTMSNATGGIREFWLRYSEVAMLRAQALAEGEKAFDFQGQAISLNVDKAQYYNTLADALQSSLDNDIRPLKMALKTSGIHGGDGDIDGTPSRNVPRLGISITPASHLTRAPGYRVW